MNYQRIKRAFASALLLLLSIASYSQNTGGDYPIQPVPFTAVKVTDQFWAPRIKRNHEVTDCAGAVLQDRPGR